MRPLSVIVLALTFLLLGLINLGAATVSGHALGWLYIADALVLVFEPVVPTVVGYFRSRQAS